MRSEMRPGTRPEPPERRLGNRLAEATIILPMKRVREGNWEDRKPLLIFTTCLLF